MLYTGIVIYAPALILNQGGGHHLTVFHQSEIPKFWEIVPLIDSTIFLFSFWTQHLGVPLFNGDHLHNLHDHGEDLETLNLLICPFNPGHSGNKLDITSWRRQLALVNEIIVYFLLMEPSKKHWFHQSLKNSINNPPVGVLLSLCQLYVFVSATGGHESCDLDWRVPDMCDAVGLPGHLHSWHNSGWRSWKSPGDCQ